MFPLSGGPARVLSTLAGLERDGTEAWFWTLTRAFETVNVMERHQPRWSAPAARESAGRILEEKPKVIVCCGTRAHRAVVDALGFHAARLHSKPRSWNSGLWGDWGNWAAPWHIKVPIFGETEERYAPWLVLIPHPSGLNRVLNDPVARENVGRVLREALALAADPSPTYPRR